MVVVKQLSIGDITNVVCKKEANSKGEAWPHQAPWKPSQEESQEAWLEGRLLNLYPCLAFPYFDFLKFDLVDQS